jgi:hypothetical protein
MQRTKIFFILCIVFISCSCIKTKNNPNNMPQPIISSDSDEITLDNTQKFVETSKFSPPQPVTLDLSGEMQKLNGTWLPHWSYIPTMNMPEEERYDVIKSFSWGEGKRKVHTTFEIDLTAREPFFIAAGDGQLFIIEISKTGDNSIKILAYTSDYFTFFKETVFHFIDNDTFWIENEEFGKSIAYGDAALWHRLSGPAQ